LSFFIFSLLNGEMDLMVLYRKNEDVSTEIEAAREIPRKTAEFASVGGHAAKNPSFGLICALICCIMAETTLPRFDS